MLTGLVAALTVPFFAVFLTETLHASPAQTSLFLFSTPVTAIALGSMIARVSDRPGVRYKILLWGAAAGVVGYGCYALSRNYWLLLAVGLTVIAVAGSLLAQVYALGAEILNRDHPEKAALGISSLRMMISFAWAAGAPAAGYVLDRIDFDGLFLVAGAMHLVILPVVLLLRVRQARAGTPTPAASPVELEVAAEPSPAAAGEPAMRTLIATRAAFVLLQAVTSLTVSAMPLFIASDLRGSANSAGIVLGTCAALEIPLMPLFGSLASRFRVYALLLAGCGFGAAYCSVAILATNIWHMVAAQILHACFVCTIGGLGIRYFQQLLPSALGRASTMFSNSGRLSGMLAGVAIGVVMVYGYRMAFVASLGFCLLGTLMLAASRPSRSSRRSARPYRSRCQPAPVPASAG